MTDDIDLPYTSRVSTYLAAKDRQRDSLIAHSLPLPVHEVQSVCPTGMAGWNGYSTYSTRSCLRRTIQDDGNKSLGQHAANPTALVTSHINDHGLFRNGPTHKWQKVRDVRVPSLLEPESEPAPEPKSNNASKARARGSCLEICNNDV